MPQTYITQAEQFILSHLPSGQFHAEDRQHIHDHVSPLLIQNLLGEYDYEDAIGFIDYVVERINIRRERARDRRLKHELLCYYSWLMNVRGQIETDYAPEKAEQRRGGLVSVVQRLMTRQKPSAHP